VFRLIFTTQEKIVDLLNLYNIFSVFLGILVCVWTFLYSLRCIWDVFIICMFLVNILCSAPAVRIILELCKAFFFVITIFGVVWLFLIMFELSVFYKEYLWCCRNFLFCSKYFVLYTKIFDSARTILELCKVFLYFVRIFSVLQEIFGLCLNFLSSIMKYRGSC